MIAGIRRRRPTVDDATLHDTVVRWFRALDRHAGVDEVLTFIDGDGFEMRVAMPDGTQQVRRGLDGFRDWYAEVTSRFFDEEHTVRDVEVRRTGTDIVVRVRVNWQTRVWDPPAAHSCWLGFEAHQTWDLHLDPGGRPRIRRYVVHSLDPMPGSSGI